MNTEIMLKAITPIAAEAKNLADILRSLSAFGLMTKLAARPNDAIAVAGFMTF